MKCGICSVIDFAELNLYLQWMNVKASEVVELERMHLENVCIPNWTMSFCSCVYRLLKLLT